MNFFKLLNIHKYVCSMKISSEKQIMLHNVFKKRKN